MEPNLVSRSFKLFEFSHSSEDILLIYIAQSAGAVEYIDCFSAEG